MTDEILAEPGQQPPDSGEEAPKHGKRKPARASKAGPIVLTGVASALVSLMGALGIQSLLANNPDVAICVLALLIAFLVGVIAFLQAPRSRAGPALLSGVCVAFIALGFFAFWRIGQDVNIVVSAGPDDLVSQNLAPLAVDIGPNQASEDVVWKTGVSGTMKGNILKIDVSALNDFYNSKIQRSRSDAASSVTNCVQGGGPG